MLVTDEEIREKIESPLNLLNRLRSVSTPKPAIPTIHPKSEDVISDLDKKLELGSVRTKAAEIMSDALKELKARIPETQKPAQLAQIAREMNQILTSESSRNEDKKTSHIVVYAPQIVNENVFETVVVKE